MLLAADAPLMARYYTPPETAGRSFAPLMLTLDPGSLAVTSERFSPGRLCPYLAFRPALHLAARQAGEDSGRHRRIGDAGFRCSAGFTCGGRARRGCLRHSGRCCAAVVRKTYDLHVLGGVYGMGVLAVLALTGSALALPDTTRELVGCLSDLRERPELASGLITDGAPALSSMPRCASPGPASGGGAALDRDAGVAGRPIAIRLYQPGEPGRRFPRTQVWVDPASEQSYRS